MPDKPTQQNQEDVTAPAAATPIAPEMLADPGDDTLPQGELDLKKQSESRKLPPRSTPADDFPQQWPRYEYNGFLGQGGMGQVFLAFDPQLKRKVALKFVRNASTELGRLLLHEAAAQAHIDHAHVCKVYEVGEVAGRPYVAMQFIEGKTLGDLAPQLSLHQKLTLMIQICDGLHAAHRLGLIHRDIKPANIMVTQNDDGQMLATIMDFGLARDARDAGETADNAIMGTPQFMAPEQARGEQKAIDRRSDVYSLGATLYALLAGRTPFVGESTVNVLLQVASDDAPMLRTLVPTVPRDLESIVMTALQREPQRRYDSARAMQEDLQRYLDGEPIAAQRDKWLYKFGKKLKKHKFLAAIAALSLLLLVALVVTGLRARQRAEETELRAQQRASESARLGQHFGAELAELEHHLQVHYLLPLHDIRPERQWVRKRLTQLRQEVQEQGELAVAPGEYALGVAEGQIGDIANAIKDLEADWATGNREPKLALALAKVWLAAYQREKDESGRVYTDNATEAKDAKVEALKYLKLAKGGNDAASSLLEGMLAYLEQNYAVALSKLELAAAQDPALHEALTLQGQVLIHLGHKQAEAGNTAESLPYYDRAEKVLTRAVDIARSQPDPHNLLCKLRVRQMEDLAPAEDVTATVARIDAAERACSDAQVVDPNDDRSLGRLAVVLKARAEADLAAGREPAGIERALETAVKAWSFAPGAAGRQRTVAEVLILKAKAQAVAHQDFTTTQNWAIALLEIALASGPEKGRRTRLYVAEAEAYTLDFDWQTIAPADYASESYQDYILAMAALESALSLEPHDYQALRLLEALQDWLSPAIGE